MRARKGCASALAIRASEVSPGGRFRPVSPDGVDDLVGMVGDKRTRHSPYHPNGSSFAPTRSRSIAKRRDSNRSHVVKALSPVERPCVVRPCLFTILLPTRSAPLTDPPKSDSADLPLGPDQSSPVAVRAVPEATGRAGGAPALPRLFEALDRALDVALRRTWVDRAQPRHGAALEDRRARRRVAARGDPAHQGFAVDVRPMERDDAQARGRRDLPIRGCAGSPPHARRARFRGRSRPGMRQNRKLSVTTRA